MCSESYYTSILHHMPHKPLCPLYDGHEFDNVYINYSVISAIYGINGHQ